MTAKTSGHQNCMWKQGDFGIKLNLEKGEGDSNEDMELKYGSRWTQEKDVKMSCRPS